MNATHIGYCLCLLLLLSNGIQVVSAGEWDGGSFFQVPSRGEAPLDVTFTPVDRYGNPTDASGWTNFAWDFQNDGIIDSTALNPTFTYTEPGVYDVSVRATNPDDREQTSTHIYCVVVGTFGIDSITPDSGAATDGDVAVTIRGQYMPGYTLFKLVNADLGTIWCKISGPDTGYDWVSDFEMSGKLPLADAMDGVYDVVLVPPGGPNMPSPVTLEKGFRVIGDIPVDSIAPDSAVVTTNHVDVTVSGKRFPPGTTFELVNATLGTISCMPGTATQISETELRGTLSFASPKEGLYDVVVTTPAGTTARLERGFEVRPIRFKPNPDGYQFNNPHTPTITWELFRDTYGRSEVEYPDGTPRERALSFYNDHIKNSGGGGTCFGMSASSLYVWKSNRAGEQTWNLGANPSIGLPGWTVFSPYPYLRTLPDWVKSFHIRHLGSVIQADTAPYQGKTFSMRMAYNALKQRMKDSVRYRQDPYELTFWASRFLWFGDYGHSVVPIRIDENPDRIVIYDSNFPGVEEYFEYDSVTGRVTSPRYSNINSIAIHPLSDILRDPGIPNLATAGTGVHLAFTDAEGRRLGYDDGEFVSEIPGASRFATSDGDGELPEAYYLGNQTVTTEVIGNGTGPGSVSILRSNALAVVNASVSPGSRDEVRVSGSGSSVEYVAGSGTGSLALTLAVEGTDSGRKASVSGFDLDPANVVNLSFGPDRDEVSILNTGPEATVNLSLEQVGAGSGAFAPGRSLRVEAGSSVRVVPSNWTDLDDAPVHVEHDLGSDGVVEYTETVGLGGRPLTLPGCASPPADHDGDGLCEDVNGNGRPDFADVVLYFNQMTWIAGNEPVSSFDYNGNGRIDFADVVWLFNHL